MSRLLLADKSALERASDAIFELGEICLCAVTRLEVLYSARTAEDFERIQGELSTFRDLRMDGETFAIALGAQRELAARGEHRVPIPDLLIAACAQQHQAGVVHVDRHYRVLARVLAFEPVALPR